MSKEVRGYEKALQRFAAERNAQSEVLQLNSGNEAKTSSARESLSNTSAESSQRPSARHADGHHSEPHLSSMERAEPPSFKRVSKASRQASTGPTASDARTEKTVNVQNRARSFGALRFLAIALPAIAVGFLSGTIWERKDDLYQRLSSLNLSSLVLYSSDAPIEKRIDKTSGEPPSEQAAAQAQQAAGGKNGQKPASAAQNVSAVSNKQVSNSQKARVVDADISGWQSQGQIALNSLKQPISEANASALLKNKQLKLFKAAIQQGSVTEPAEPVSLVTLARPNVATARKDITKAKVLRVSKSLSEGPVVKETLNQSPPIEVEIAQVPSKRSLETPTLKETRTKPALASGFVLQLAALRNPSLIQSEWQRFQSQAPELLGDMRLHVEKALVKGKLYYRIQTGPFPTRATVEDFCAQLKLRQMDCLVKDKESWADFPNGGAVKDSG